MMAESGSRRWPAPAKLNLFLHVTGRRADGYHELQTLFQLLDWGDEIHPTDYGYRLIAEEFAQAINHEFPGTFDGHLLRG